MKKNATYLLRLLLLITFGTTFTSSVFAEFMRGMDISIQTRQEEDGVVYNEYGVPKDILVILANHDINWIRIRIFHTPDGSIYGVCQDLDYVTDLAARVKAAGFKFLLDFHYSDTWADPGNQTIPAAWSGLNHSQLVTAVHDYTRDVIAHLRQNNAMPDMVQIGNEIPNGMLWPDGRISTSGWSNFVDLVNAGIDGVNDGRGTQPMPEIMIHIDRGGDWSTTQWFFDNLISRGVQFDIIGQSFYPEWHGTLADLSNCLTNMGQRYSQDVILAEVGEYYTGSGKSPENQKAFLEDVIQLVENMPNGRGRGVCYWEPTWVWSSNVGNRALFEPINLNWRNVNMLMGMEAFDVEGDAIPPDAPTGLTAAAGDGTADLDWNNNTEGDLEGYNVYRSMTSGGPYTQLNSSLVSSSDYTDSTVVGDNTYYYVVTAADTSSNESDPSSEESVSFQYTGIGSILRQWWTGISGTAVTDLTSDADYPDNPAGSEWIAALEAPTDWNDNYGTRIRGWLHPAASGDYTFWIAGDDNCRLFLSTDGDPANASLIAEVTESTGWTDPHEWDKDSAQQSAPISLTAGQKYYIEALHKEGTGGDHLAVAWSGPGISQQVIDGTYLSPYFIGQYGDFTGSGSVMLEDLAEFLSYWMEEDCTLTAGMDLNGDCRVDMAELSILLQNWLGGM